MNAIKQLWKDKKVKIWVSAAAAAIVLAAVFLIQPWPDDSSANSGEDGLRSASGSQAGNVAAGTKAPGSAASLPGSAPTSTDPAVSGGDATVSEHTGSGTQAAQNGQGGSQNQSGSSKAGDSKTPAAASGTADSKKPSTSKPATPPKDQYQTDPVPPGKPAPQNPEDVAVNPGTKFTCTVSVRCDTILGNMDKFNRDKLSVLPANGVILPATTVTFSEGESAFDVLQRVTKDKKIHMEANFMPIYNSAYIEGIGNIYELDCGPLSGWMYKVGGWFPNYGCSRYALQNGDKLEFLYSCDMGKDIGGNNATG